MFKAEYISLFGVRLILHERYIGDLWKLEDLKKSFDDIDAQRQILLSLQMFTDAMRLNIEKCYLHLGPIKILFRYFRKRKLKKIFSKKYLLDNLGIGELNRYLDKVNIQFEGLERSTDEDTPTTMSRKNMISLVANFTHCTWDEVYKMSVSEFKDRLEQAVKIAVIYGGGKYDPLTEEEKQENLNKEYAAINWDNYAGWN